MHLPTGVSSPPPLSDQYRKSRTYYGIFSGLLLAQIFDGTQIQAKSLLASIGLNFATPDGLPIVLTVLVFYFTFLTCVEWCQCDSTRRSLKPSRIDFMVSHVIGIASTFTYWVQHILPPQFGQMVIDRAPTLLILSAVFLFWPFGRIVWHFVSTGFLKDRWCSRTPIARLLTFILCFSVVQTFYIDYAVASIMGSQILVKGNSTYLALYISTYSLYFLGYAFHELLFSRLPVLAFLKKI